MLFVFLITHTNLTQNILFYISIGVILSNSARGIQMTNHNNNKTLPYLHSLFIKVLQQAITLLHAAFKVLFTDK